MKEGATAYLKRALGKLPDAAKAGFIEDALQTLQELHDAHAVWQPRPQKADRTALARIGRQTTQLIDAINAAQESETAMMLLQDVWLNLNRETGEPLGNPMPTLLRLRQAIEFCVPDRKAANRPNVNATASSVAVITLADHYRKHFDRAPTFRGASPFLAFLREALPVYGLHLPPVADIRRMAGAK